MVIQANNIMEYFLKHKLILYGYDLNFNDVSFDSIIIDNFKKLHLDDEKFDHFIPKINAKINIMIKKIFMPDQNSMNATAVPNKGRLNQA